MQYKHTTITARNWSCENTYISLDFHLKLNLPQILVLRFLDSCKVRPISINQKNIVGNQIINLRDISYLTIVLWLFDNLVRAKTII